jgi:hypothetical protein
VDLGDICPPHGPTVDTLEDVVFPGHVAAPEPSTWWGRVLFTMRLEIATRAPHLHTVVRGTPILGYRQWPPGPPLGGYERLARRFRALADVITASPPSVTLTATSVPAAD